MYFHKSSNGLIQKMRYVHQRCSNDGLFQNRNGGCVVMGFIIISEYINCV